MPSAAAYRLAARINVRGGDRLLGNVGPDRIIDILRTSQHELGDTHLHYFSFGGVVSTARYARDLAQSGIGQGAASNRSAPRNHVTTRFGQPAAAGTPSW